MTPVTIRLTESFGGRQATWYTVLSCREDDTYVPPRCGVLRRVAFTPQRPGSRAVVAVATIPNIRRRGGSECSGFPRLAWPSRLGGERRTGQLSWGSLHW